MRGAQDGAQPTVLVVDDDAPIRDLVGEILAVEGFVIVACGDVRSATETIETAGPPDIAVIDYQLPDGTGTQLCKTLRGRGVPCVVISGYSRSLEPTMEVKADAWVAKPFEAADLVLAVRELLHPSGRSSAASARRARRRRCCGSTCPDRHASASTMRRTRWGTSLRRR